MAHTTCDPVPVVSYADDAIGPRFGIRAGRITPKISCSIDTTILRYGSSSQVRRHSEYPYVNTLPDGAVFSLFHQ